MELTCWCVQMGWLSRTCPKQTSEVGIHGAEWLWEKKSGVERVVGWREQPFLIQVAQGAVADHKIALFDTGWHRDMQQYLSQSRSLP